MQPLTDGELHDRPHSRAPGRVEDDAHARPQAAVARSLRQRAAPFNRRYLESRLAYRIQELAYGGLKPETVRRLQELGDEIGPETAPGRRRRREGLPIVGTRLIREWQGVEHLVTVTAQGFEWQGRPYRSLSAIARAITGTRWNGWVFFGLKNHRRRA